MSDDLDADLDAAKELLETAKEDPAEVDLEDAFPVLESEHPTARSIAMRAVAAVAADDASRLVPYAEDLRPRLDDSSLVVQTAAVAVFGHLAEEDYELVLDDVGTLVDMLDENPPLLRYRAAMALRSVLLEDREAFVPHVAELVDVVVDGPRVTIPDPDDPDLPEDQRAAVESALENRAEEFDKDKSRSQGVFELVANAIVEVAEVDPELLAEYVEDLTDALDAERPIVRTPIVDTIGTVAEHDPEAAAPAIDALRERLQDDAEYVQAHAVRALGFAEATEAVDDLREVAADEERDETLRELAEDTADWLESRA